MILVINYDPSKRVFYFVTDTGTRFEFATREKADRALGWYFEDEYWHDERSGEENHE